MRISVSEYSPKLLNLWYAYLQHVQLCPTYRKYYTSYSINGYTTFENLFVRQSKNLNRPTINYFNCFFCIPVLCASLKDYIFDSHQPSVSEWENIILLTLSVITQEEVSVSLSWNWFTRFCRYVLCSLYMKVTHLLRLVCQWPHVSEDRDQREERRCLFTFWMSTDVYVYYIL